MSNRSTASLWLANGCIILAVCGLLLAIVEWSTRTVFKEALPKYPAQKIIYRTSEFDATASINVFGFRGLERQIARGQILTIGDSFTFGWGVNDHDTWQTVLAAKLLSKGMAFSVYNLGRPGAGPDEYLDIARTYIPLFKPRIVIISILQGDDPGQLLERLDKPSLGSGPETGISGPMTYLYKLLESQVKVVLSGLYRAARALRVSFEGPRPDTLVTQNWHRDFARLVLAGNLKFPEDIAQMARSGNLNPSLLALAARQPRHFVAAYNQGAIDRVEHALNEILGQIASLSKAHGASVIVLSMPYSAFFNDVRNGILSRMGFELPAPGECAMDNLVGRVARSLGIGFMTLTNELRRQPSREDLWFKYDGHLTVKGNAIVADYLDTRIVGVMRSDFSRANEVPYFGEACSVVNG